MEQRSDKRAAHCDRAGCGLLASRRFTTPRRARQIRGLVGLLLVLAPVAVADAKPGTVGSSTPALSPETTRLELPELRTRSSRTYRNGDGTRTAEISAGSLNYRDASGNWRPINTELVPATEPGYAWQNETNSARTLFKPLAGEGFLRFDIEGQPFSLSLEGARPAPAVAGGSRITYAGVSHAVDLRYDLFNDGARKSLVLRDASAPSSYRFLLDAPSGVALEPRRESDGSWTLRRAGDSARLLSLAVPFAQETVPGPRRRNLTSAEIEVRREGSTFAIA